MLFRDNATSASRIEPAASKVTGLLAGRHSLMPCREVLRSYQVCPASSIYDPHLRDSRRPLAVTEGMLSFGSELSQNTTFIGSGLRVTCGLLNMQSTPNTGFKAIRPHDLFRARNLGAVIKLVGTGFQ